MSAFLKKQPRDLVLNLCQYGNGDVWKWGKEVGGNSWRTADDLGRGYYAEQLDFMGREVFDRYARTDSTSTADRAAGTTPTTCCWATSGRDAPGSRPSAQYSHVSLWALVAAPLIFGGDITRLDDCTLSLLCNDEVIEVDQDPLGKPGRRVAKSGDQEVWARTLEDGSLAVGLFNRNVTAATVTAKWSDLGVQGKQRVRDLWRQKDFGTMDGQFSATLPGEGVMLIRLWPVAKCAQRLKQPAGVPSHRVLMTALTEEASLWKGRKVRPKMIGSWSSRCIVAWDTSVEKRPTDGPILGHRTGITPPHLVQRRLLAVLPSEFHQRKCYCVSHSKLYIGQKSPDD